MPLPELWNVFLERGASPPWSVFVQVLKSTCLIFEIYLSKRDIFWKFFISFLKFSIYLFKFWKKITRFQNVFVQIFHCVYLKLNCICLEFWVLALLRWWRQKSRPMVSPSTASQLSTPSILSSLKVFESFALSKSCLVDSVLFPCTKNVLSRLSTASQPDSPNILSWTVFALSWESFFILSCK